MTAHALIDLMRHGDTGQRSYRGRLDDPLSESGWMQARAVVAGRSWDRVIASPLQRCAAFARELATARHLPLRLDPRLVEYDFGMWQGVPIDVIAGRAGAALAQYWADPAAHPPPRGESFASFRTRVCEALDDAVREAGTQRTLIITHGGVIRLLRCIAERRPFGDMAGLAVPNASLYSLRRNVHASV